MKLNLNKLLIVTLTLSSNVFAISNYSSINSSKFSLEKQKETGFSGDIEFSSNQIADNVGEVPGNEYFGDLGLKYEVKESEDTLKKRIDLKARLNSASSLMFSVPEAYLKSTFENSELTVGRVVLPWSKADQNWGFGSVNNRINFDGFSPGQEGLTGVRYVYSITKNFKVEGFGSVTYIPELNPGLDIDEENGTIDCNNPWCDAPDSTTTVGGSDVPIFYNVNMPEIDEVVFKPSMGIRLAYDNNFFDISGFFTRKPENTISTSVEVRYENDNQRVFADITPEIYYHNVFGGDLGFQVNKNLRLYGTAIAIRPDRNPETSGKVFQYLGIRPKKIAEEYAGGGAEFNDGRLVTSLNYIARLSDFEKVDDPLIQYPRWNQAIHFNIGSKLSRKLSLALDYKYDTLTEDRLTMFKASYLLKPSVITSFGFNMVGSAKSADSYWAKYTNNDMLYGSLKYTF